MTTIDRQLWLNNLLEVARAIADRDRQEIRWIASDRLAWETPEELLNSFDDCNFEQLTEQHHASMTTSQRAAAKELCQSIDQFCEGTPKILVEEEVLADRRWQQVRDDATEFVRVFA